MRGHGGAIDDDGPDDAVLVARARTGDQQAFSTLYERHRPTVRKVAAAYVRRPEIVADVVQDTFVRALEKLPSLRDPSLFRPWLLAIARHSAVDHGRKAVRDVALDQDAAEGVPSGDAAPDEAFALAELARRVTTAIDGLSGRDAATIALVTHLGFRSNEVAAALGVSTGAAKVTVHRARRRLRTALSLEALQREPELACEAMRVALGQNRAAAVRHLDGCATCLDAASAEVTAFEFTPLLADS